MKNLQPVIDNDLCIGCGACVAADPSLRLRLEPNKLMYEPDGAGNERAAAACPSLQVDFESLQQNLFPSSTPTPLGVIDGGVFLAQSTNRDRNLKASSGGIIKELMLQYLERPDVDGVIALGHVEGLRYEPQLWTTREQIERLPGSIYHSLDFSKALEILQSNEGRFVLVAIPCQLEGIYQHIFKHAPELEQRIFATIGLICGWTYTHHALKAVAGYTGADFDRLTDVSYRGGGPVGPLRLVEPNKETRVHRRVSFHYQVAFDRSFNVPRCHLCIDHTNFLADVVVADAWLPSTVRTRTGISLVLCRRADTRAHLETLRDAGRVRLTEVGHEDVVESQTRRVAYGDFAYAYAEWLQARGEHVPDMVGPNRAAARLRPAAEAQSFHSNNREKIALQRQGRYRDLWLRKMTREIGPYAWRYVRWFGVRVLKLKSLFGVRQEVDKDKLQDFE